MGEIKDIVTCVLTEDFLNLSNDDVVFHQLCSISEEYELFNVDSQSVAQLIRKVNDSMLKSKERHVALCVLHMIVKQCNTALFLENWSKWSLLLLKTLKSYPSSPTYALACETISHVLHYSKEFPAINREISKSYIGPLMTELLEADAYNKDAAMTCIRMCYEYYPGPVDSFKAKVHKLVEQALESSTESNLDEITNLVSLLPLGGGAGTLGRGHSDAWDTQYLQLKNSLAVCLKQLYDCLEIDFDYILPVDGSNVFSPLTKVFKSTQDNILSLQWQYKIITQCLCKQLQQQLPATVHIPTKEILEIVCLTLATHPKLKSLQVGHDKAYLCSVLPLVHCDALNLLTVFVERFGTQLLDNCNLMVMVMKQSLAWTKTPNIDRGKNIPFRGVRVSAYKLLDMWLQTMGAASHIESSPELIDQILSDIEPRKVSLRIKPVDPNVVQMPSIVNRKHDKKNKNYSSNLGQMASEQKYNNVANQDVCQSALQALSTLLQKIGCLLPASAFKKIQDTCTTILLSFHNKSLESISPYSDSSCRLGLYKVLLNCVLNPSFAHNPATHVAVQLFSNGQQDYDRQVASCCSEALLICQALLHPRLPTLHSQHQEATNSTVNHQETDETQPSADLLSFMKSLDHLADKAGNMAASNDDEIVNISDSPMPSVVTNDNAQVVEVSDNVVEKGAAAGHGKDEDVISIDDDDDEGGAGDLKDADDCVVIDEDTVSEVDDCPKQNEPLDVDSDEKSPSGNQKHHDEPQSDEEVLSSGAEEGDEEMADMMNALVEDGPDSD